jgi:hypothetical protein
MRPITLNLATRPFRNNTVVGSALAAIIVALVLATAYNLYFFLHYGGNYAQLQSDETTDRARLETIEGEEAKLAQEIQGRDFKRLYDRGRFASDLILRRSFSWTLLFNRLETVVPPEVMMTAIRPNITTDAIAIRIEGVAKNQGAFIALQEKLQANPAFARVYPVNERRLNPSRPETTFALTFGYMPKAAPAAVVAAAAGGDRSPAGTIAQAAAHPAPAATAAPTQPVVVTPPSPAAAAASPPSAAAVPAARAATPPIGTVGRDGRPRTAAVLARLVAAPGGVYVPPGAAKEDRGGAGKDATAKHKGKPAEAAPPSPPAGPGRSAGATPPASGEAASAAGRSGARGDGPPVPPAVPPTRAAQVPIMREPGMPPAPGSGRPLWRPPEESRAVPAVRLDVPLDFMRRPVGEIYDALARAHGVRFQIDPGVDPHARVTANLSGRKLADAIEIVARAAGHRVTRQAEGVYRVVLPAGGEPIADRPIREESLPPPGGTP